MKAVLILGRVLFSAIFVMSGYSHFSAQTQAYAASQGVPPVMVMASGVLACLGGMSVALGFRARLGAWMLVAFLVPVTLAMHKFWGLSDPQAAQLQFVNFMKNLSLLGGALIIAYAGSGPGSLDSRGPSRQSLEVRRPPVLTKHEERPILRR